MKRRLFNLAAAVATLLFVIVCVAWVRSYRVSDFAQFDRADHQRRVWTRWEFWLQRGLFRFGGSTISQQACAPSETLVGWPAGWHREELSSSEPRLLGTWESLEGTSNQWVTFPGQPPPAGVYCAGFGYFTATYRLPTGQLEEYRYALVPLWAIAAGCLVLLALRLLGWTRARHRRHSRLCPTCAYDLRATPGRCPECGTVRQLMQQEAPR